MTTLTPLFKSIYTQNTVKDMKIKIFDYLVGDFHEPLTGTDEDAKLDTMYNTVIDITNISSQHETISEPSACIYYAKYPICWFRSSMFVNVFGNKFIRRIFTNITEDLEARNPKSRLLIFTEALSNLFEKRDETVYCNSVKNEQFCIMMESIILFYMVLLNKHDTSYANSKNVSIPAQIGYNYHNAGIFNYESFINHIQDDELVIGNGYYSHRFALRYFLYDFKNLFDIHPLVNLNSTVISDSPTTLTPFIASFMTSKYKAPTDVLFYTHNTTQYTLTSISIANYNKNKNGHAVGLYCSTDNRFYSWEHGVTDMYLLEHIIMNLDLDGIDWWNKLRLFFNAHKGNLIYIYTPTIPLFSYQEVQHLRELAAFVYQEKNKGSKKVTLSSLFACFQPTRILLVDAQPELNLPRFIAILLYFVRKCTVTVEGSEVHTLSCEPVNDGDYTLTIKEETSINIPVKDKPNDDTFITHYVNTLQAHLVTNFVNKKLNTISNTMCRYSEHATTIYYMLNVINKYIQQKQAPPKGGRQKKKELIMKKTQKVYKIRMNKAKQSYILMNKKKVLLADIKGRYTLRRCD